MHVLADFQPSRIPGAAGMKSEGRGLAQHRSGLWVLGNRLQHAAWIELLKLSKELTGARGRDEAK